ncbi:DNA repair ATPase [Phaeobacter gallaeciensis]|uniref:DNA repair ATPase n=1 Tax=Phaeobacter gallaeciensis TaxID=60890 RepID=A0A1B0ZQQ7_9RHOB|nr:MULTISPECIES: hypothetical protein [Phaeobacter]ANP36509.1 DNA repair ATPase [Phaeobacter gallaeciensis]PVZ45066.1 hypothetical protein DD556_18535 [Phaeobacter sp. JL2872]
MSNKIIFSPESSIGNVSAETDDEFLFKCFVDHPALASIRDMGNAKMFLLGSTGVGKTAFLRMIEKNENAKFLELQELSMSYLSNSDTIQFLRKIDVDISFFLQALWRHVICIELIKMATNIEGQSDAKGFLSKLFNRGQEDATRKFFLDFVEKNQGNFWNTIDETVIEVANRLEKDINAEFGVEIQKASARAGYSRGLSEEKKTQFQQRAKKFVNPSLLAELSKVINGLSQYLSERPDKYYILIDGLDEHWIEPEIKNTIIHCLFEACKGLRKIRNLKVVVSIRNDVYEKMNMEYPPSQGQLEKNEDYIVRIKWTREQLWELVEKRIGHLYRWKYTKDNVHFVDLFKTSYDNKKRSWVYIVERSLMRPRDVIKYVNFCFSTAEGKSEISKTDFRNAEKVYSDDRLEALISEWSPVFPGISIILNLLSNRATYFQISDFCHTKFVEELALIFAENEAAQRDEMWGIIEDAVKADGSFDPLEFCREIFHRLHLVGAVGLKLSSSSAWHWVHLTHKPIPKNSITTDTKATIHPMLWRAFENTETKEHKS